MYYVIISIFQVTEDEICGTFSISSGLLMSVSVLDKSVATSSSVGSVSIYDTETMKETDWLPCHDDAECWIVTLGQNKQMFTGGDDSYFRLWVRTNKNRNSTRNFEIDLLP